jgi:two-component system LytT family response regulator
MKPIKTVIVDDEARNRTLIAELLESAAMGFEVCGMAAGVEEGKKMIGKLQPNVVFVDIRMQDGTGFDLLNSIENHNFETVFITAYDEYALKAFEFNAIDYVLKPIDVNRFEKMLDRVQQRLAAGVASTNDNLKQLTSDQGVINKIPVHFRDNVMLFDLDEIEALQAHEGCTVFVVAGKGKYTSSKQLSDFEFILERFSFFTKVSKSVYINLNFISSYSKGAYCTITMNSGEVHEVSRRQKARILELLAKGK